MKLGLKMIQNLQNVGKKLFSEKPVMAPWIMEYSPPKT